MPTQTNLQKTLMGSDPPVFTVRPLLPDNPLDGASFRVHITSKDLESLGLRPGDLCELRTSDGSTGAGIAWRSADQTKSQTPPVKLSKTLREAFDFKLGNHLTIIKATSRVHHAARVVVVGVSDDGSADPSKDDSSWLWDCGHLLAHVEAIANRVIFETSSRKGLKRRFRIEAIKSDGNEGSDNSLFYFDNSSELVILDEPPAPTGTSQLSLGALHITSEDIGGLKKQIEFLNKRLTRLIGEVKGRRLPRHIQRNGGILLYGPEGTGKSLLLNRLAQAPWRKVFYIDKSCLAGTTSKSQATVRGIFAESVAQQPSLIIMDNVDEIAGSQEHDSGSVTQTLAVELDKLEHTQVLVVAATSKPNNIHKSLRKTDRLAYELEVPIPDMRARIEILKVLQKPSTLETEAIAERIGERTHGFVGEDLKSLCKKALDSAVERFLHDPDSDSNHVEDGRDSDSTSTLVESRDSSQDTSTSAHESAIMIRQTLADYESALLEVRPSAMREIFLETPKVLWSEIGGSSNIKEALNEVIEWPLKYPRAMAALNLTPQKGILLYGPPGCSKTLTAKAVATSSGLNFIAVKGAELTSMYVGESERAVREVFRKARAAAPSIIFFDEIDSIGSERDAGGTKGLNVLTTLLNEMDGIESLKGVLVLAATNKPEVLDPALLRPGRFDSLMYIGPPNEAARTEIFRIQTRAVPLAGDVDVVELARETEGYSGAEIVNICLEAARAPMRRHVGTAAGDGALEMDEHVAREDFVLALQKTVRRITPDMTEAYVRWRDGLSKKV